MVLIGRAVNGISINGLEWLLDDNNKPMKFKDGKTAKKFLLDNGIKAKNIHAYWFEDEKTGLRLNIK